MSILLSPNGHRVTIIVGGFGGLCAARRLSRDARVITGQPLLPEIAEPEEPPA